ncbi:phosphoglycerate mutase-like protein [Hypoxylon rubiginosum]|uniref:Phosphoglycerate mutase-like protein n=1 Tax=Hypoxylon rubiginosum TaxID=110542 RepID=A0ACB9ZFP3_9PEZI|nr:phosphoglycerate mutase-like protein [Hypoxylon rubiginosum]
MVFSYLRRRALALMAGSPYKYMPLHGDGVQTQHPRPTSWFNRNIVAIRLAMVVLLSITITFFSLGFMQSIATQPCSGVSRDRHCRTEVTRSWGQYSSSFTVPSKISPSVPEGCEVTFAQLLARHGARDPTEHKSSAYAAVVDRIHDNVTQYGKDFKFIKDYKYTLGADQLTPFGEQQMVDSGLIFHKRYQPLASINLPFLRASGQERVVESAKKWAEGFHEARLGEKHSHVPDTYPYNILVIPEEDNFNNSLSPNICPAFEDSRYDSHDEQGNWLNRFGPPITDRLNENLPGANLSDQETIHMMDLCPFNTVANEKGKLSEFCYLFTVDEWHDYDYYQSLGKWYGYGNGSPLGPTQGVGFVNELLARLTGKPVVDDTTTNSTLDESPATFPLDRVLYADFSHDNDMVDIFAALGLHNLTDSLPGDRRMSADEAKGFSASWVVPFASRLYVEKMSCGRSDEEFVRILVNDRVIPLQNCGVDDFGRCTLGKFVESQSFARNGGHWNKCFV